MLFTFQNKRYFMALVSSLPYFLRNFIENIPLSAFDVICELQLIDSDQYQKILKMRERLNEADKYWKYDDLDEMR